MTYLCDESSKILANTLPEATGILRLASKNRTFHVILEFDGKHSTNQLSSNWEKTDFSQYKSLEI